MLELELLLDLLRREVDVDEDADDVNEACPGPRSSCRDE